MSYLEFHFLLLIKFDLNVDEDLYNKYFNSLLSCQDDSDEEYEVEEKENNQMTLKFQVLGTGSIMEFLNRNRNA